MKLLDQIQKVDEEISARLVLQQEDSFTHKLAALIGHSCDSWYWLIGLTLVWAFTRGPVRTTAILWAFCASQPGGDCARREVPAEASSS